MWMNRVSIACALLLVSTSALSAQITTYIAPPRPQPLSALAVATADSATKDSVQRVTLTNMKAWVDSAAGVPVPAYVGTVDSAALANDPGRPVTTTFSDGTVAPATASDLPALAVLGLVGLIVGARLLVPSRRE
jgi:hypothetical protein